MLAVSGDIHFRRNDIGMLFIIVCISWRVGGSRGRGRKQLGRRLYRNSNRLYLRL